jgi:hypothetical protein
MIVSPRLKQGDSIRIDADTYAVAGQYLYDSPLVRWYEWPLYDAINARWLLVAQVAGGLLTAQRERVELPVPPEGDDECAPAGLGLKAHGAIRFESADSTGTKFGSGRFWRFECTDGSVVIITQIGEDAGKLTGAPLDQARYVIYPA